jgi:hypothetical protein
MTNEQPEQTATVNYVTNVVNNNNAKDIGWAMIFIGIIMQSIMFLCNSFYKLDLDLTQLWFPAIVLAVFICVPLLTNLTKR